MKKSKLEELLLEYESSHQHSTNRFIHKICVPIITLSLLGLLYCIPKGPWCTLFLVSALAYYASLSVRLAIVMLIIVGSSCISVMEILKQVDLHETHNIFWISTISFIVSWIFQFIGHHIEGKKPSFFKDLQFLLIGPIWTLRTFVNQKYWLPSKSQPCVQNQNS